MSYVKATLVLITLDGRDAEKAAAELEWKLQDMRDSGEFVFHWTKELCDIKEVGSSTRCPWK